MSNYFSQNLKYIRENKGISKNKMGEMVGVNQTTIGRWESNEIKPSIDNVEEVAKVLNVPLPDLLIKDLRFDNAELIDISTNNVKIPVLGFIKAGVPIEAQEDIVEYIDIPQEWTKGNKKYYGLKISGDSMYPNYNENDTVIFLQTNDVQNGKDCAVMVNCTECTFKKVYINEQGIILQPYNNSYTPMVFTKEQVNELPVKVVGIAVERRSKIN